MKSSDSKIKVRCYSDLHLDWYTTAFHQTRVVDENEPDTYNPFWHPPELPDDKDTILILAGDLWVGTRFIEYAGYSWIGTVAKRFKQVLIVLGNHDYWPGNHHLTIDKGGDDCNAFLVDMGIDNVKVLDMSTYEEGDYIFVGATLWTDMDKGDPIAMYSMNSYMSYDGKIAKSTGANGAWVRFTSEEWVRTHCKHRDYIQIVAKNNPDKKIVVITHHAPLLGCIDPSFRGHMSNAYYVSDLSDLIIDNENVIMWVYGHCHYQMDFVFPPYAEEGSGCRIVNNCVGYISEHLEDLGRINHSVIEI